jgi:membrane-associated protease RseP (regulator of RpoE activity)
VASVIAFHEAGHFSAARIQNITVDSFSIGFGPKVLSYNDSAGVEFCLRALPLGGYVSFPQNVVFDDDGNVVEELEAEDYPDLLQNRPPLQRALVISAGVIANILLTFLLSTGTSLSTGIGHPQFGDGIVVSAIPSESSPSALAGFQAGDVIVGVDKRRLTGSETIISDFVSTVRDSSGQSLGVDVMRGEKQLHIDVKPVGGPGKGTLGLKVNSIVSRVEAVKARNIAEAAQEGYKETVRLFQFTYSALSRAVSSGFQGAEVGGPISVVRTGAAMAESSGVALVGFAATLSINLALLNALPLPALDGGQLVFVLAELVSGKKMDGQVKDTIVAVTFGALLLVSAGTLFSDITSLGSPMENISHH